jgi:hypothetical protein
MYLVLNPILNHTLVDMFPTNLCSSLLMLRLHESLNVETFRGILVIMPS